MRWEGKGEVELEFLPLHPAFGAKVADFDLMRPASQGEITQLRAALDRYQLLLFPSRSYLEPDRQVEVTSWFGPVTDNGGGLWSVLHNENQSGSRRLPFHSDFSYTDAPIDVISLQAVDIPPGGTTTAFASGIHAWDALLPDRQKSLEKLTLRHRYRPAEPADWPEFVADHPLRLPHPRTGRPVLYATEHHAEFVHGLDEPESNRLIDELLGHLYAPERVYLHDWQPNDLLIWDNIAIQHARPEQADAKKGVRSMQRATVNRVALPQLVERARQAERERALAR